MNWQFARVDALYKSYLLKKYLLQGIYYRSSSKVHPDIELHAPPPVPRQPLLREPRQRGHAAELRLARVHVLLTADVNEPSQRFTVPGEGPTRILDTIKKCVIVTTVHKNVLRLQALWNFSKVRFQLSLVSSGYMVTEVDLGDEGLAPRPGGGHLQGRVEVRAAWCNQGTYHDVIVGDGPRLVDTRERCQELIISSL